MNTIICNKCGKNDVGTEDIDVKFEYGSGFNMMKFSLHLCDDCIEDFVESCVHKPEGYGFTGFEDYWYALKDACEGK